MTERQSESRYQKELAVCGFEAVKALTTHHPEKISRFFFASNRAKHFGEVCKYLATKKRVYRMIQAESELEKLSESVHHQGVVAMITAPIVPTLSYESLDRWAKEGEKVIMLDRVGNANNLGAIIRSAAFFGIKNIIVSQEDSQAKITTATYRVAQGGMEFVHLHEVSSIHWLLRAIEGKITSIGADGYAYRKIQDLSQIVEPNEAVIVILGNEEQGINDEAKKKCTHLVKIAGAGTIESLNVAQAGTLFLHALTQLQ